VQVFVCSANARDGAPLRIPELAGDDPRQLATLTWDELQGVVVGSHGVTHAHLPRLSDEELRRELVESKQEIEDELRRPCPDFAYPYGEHDERVRAAVRAAGYERAYGLVDDGREPYALRRIDLYRRHSPYRALLRLYT
jgi:peptidoglycan/xylan/chitin deacetylase (PgdA/CDA1 family)